MTLPPASSSRLVRRTPLIEARFVGDGVWLKLESLQRTGSFKLRGAVSACASLTADERRRGIVVASAGNHGAGMALAASAASISLTVVVPRGTPETKLAKIRGAGGLVHIFDGDYDGADAFARKMADDRDAVFVSAFDDERVIAGNGDSLAVEIAAQRADVATVVLPVGGGGMIAGVARTLAPGGVEVIGAQPQNNCAMHDSLKCGRALTDYAGEHTIAEGCEGAVGALAFSIAKDHIASVALVSEDEIEAAVRAAYHELGLVIECSGAVGLAALMAGLVPLSKGPLVCVISGGNIDESELDRILCHRPRL